jgi:hypothetical protein
MFVKSLNPIVLGSEFEAQIFSRKEIDRVMYEYGLEDDYTPIEIDDWVPGGFEIADSKDEEKMLANYERE